MLNAVFSQPYPYRYPPLPEKQLGGLYYIRRHMYAPEVIPIVGIVLCSAGMGVYFSQGIGTTKNQKQFSMASSYLAMAPEYDCTKIFKRYWRSRRNDSKGANELHGFLELGLDVIRAGLTAKL
ncbi:hypothetical protein OPQ81_008538 [Rhizoctonia solani]|nr:hypothetical protein OPQ81_008538 [Rhizoctonia solani]